MGLLQELRIQNNSLTGTLPSCLGKMKNLGVLDVSSNLLTGRIPRLNNLQILRLSDNLHLSGSIDDMWPAESRPNTLVSLAFSRTSVAGTLPHWLLDSATADCARWVMNGKGTCSQICQAENLRCTAVGWPHDFHDFKSDPYIRDTCKSFSHATTCMSAPWIDSITGECSWSVPCRPNPGTCEWELNDDDFRRICWCKPAALVELHASYTKLTGSLPVNSHSPSELRVLDLSNNLGLTG